VVDFKITFSFKVTRNWTRTIIRYWR